MLFLSSAFVLHPFVSLLFSCTHVMCTMLLLEIERDFEKVSVELFLYADYSLCVFFELSGGAYTHHPFSLLTRQSLLNKSHYTSNEKEMSETQQDCRSLSWKGKHGMSEGFFYFCVVLFSLVVARISLGKYTGCSGYVICLIL